MCAVLISNVRPGVAPLDEPALVKTMREDPDNYQVFAANVDHPAVVKRVSQNPAIRVGVMGDPALASAELGERICQEAVGNLVSLIGTLQGS